MTTTFREITKDGELIVRWHPGQERAWLSTARIVNIQSGTQGGKTSFGPHWLDREMDTEGPGDYLAVTATYPLLNLKMLPELKYFFETLLRRFEWKAADRVFLSHELHHGSPAYRIIVGSAANPESLESATAKGAWLDEAGQHQFGRAAWEAIQRRLSLHRGRTLITTTPYEWGWHKVEVYDRGLAGKGDIENICFRSVDNPAFPKAEDEEQRESLPWWKYRMFYHGEYERPAGAIYDTFDSETQVIDRFNIPAEWPRYVGHDFGPDNTAAIWLAQDPGTGWMYVYREYKAGGKSVGQHVEQFKKLSQGEWVRKMVGGAAGKREEEIRYAYRAAGWPIKAPTIEGVEAGITHAYSFVARGQLFVFRDCDGFTNEMMTYSRKLDENYQPTDEIQDKSRYHYMDCLRAVLSPIEPERANRKEAISVQTFRGKRKDRRRGTPISKRGAA